MDCVMSQRHFLTERHLAAVAKRFRKQAGKTRARAARDLGVAQTSIFNAEESPELSLLKLRMRIIATYSPYKVRGPVFVLERK